MSRGNVFKLSGNMALGGGNDYQNVDIDEIKNSLKLLKAKKNKQNASESQPNYGGSYGSYGNSYGNSNPKNYTPTRNEYDYDAMTKNHLPSSSKDIGSDYSRKNYGGANDYNKYSAPSKNQYRDEKSYDYPSKTPPVYQQNSNQRNGRNSKQQPDSYDSYNDAPTYQNSKPVGKNTASTRGSNANRPPVKQKYDDYDDYGGGYGNDIKNNKEERSIKEVNRENQVDIIEYDPSELRMCKMGCGRKFNPDSIKKHQANCKKVFQKKRKEFDAQKHRLVDKQQVKFMKKGEIVDKKIEKQKVNEKIPKWKAQSLAFRAVLKNNRNEDLDPKQAQMMKEAEQIGMVKCHICGRTFNETAGPRHIKFCEEKAKKDGFKKKR